MSALPLNSASSTLTVGGVELTRRDIGSADRDAVLGLHTLVFGPEVDAAWYAWKYGQAAAQGQGQAAGLWHGGELIAYCGGLPRTLWQHGQSLRGLQIGDVMVHPAWRGILTRRGPFHHVSQGFYDSRLGAAPQRPFQLGYGFPSARHLRLAVLQGLLSDAGVVETLHWDLGTEAALPWHWRWQDLAPSAQGFDRCVNHAWRAMQKGSGRFMLGQRDAAYLRWRYVDRPAALGSAGTVPRYRFFALRRPWPGGLGGVAVMDLRSTSAHWLDWVGPTDLLPLASRACRLQALSSGAVELTTWASAAVARQLEGTGITRREVCAGLGMPVRSDLDPKEATRVPWWLMGGDTDFL